MDNKKGALNRADIQDILRVKDLYNFGQTIMELLLGKKSRKYNPNGASVEYYQAYCLEQIPEVWSTRPELAGFIEILNSCFQLKMIKSPLEELKYIVLIAQRIF